MVKVELYAGGVPRDYGVYTKTPLSSSQPLPIAGETRITTCPRCGKERVITARIRTLCTACKLEYCLRPKNTRSLPPAVVP